MSVTIRSSLPATGQKSGALDADLDQLAVLGVVIEAAALAAEDLAGELCLAVGQVEAKHLALCGLGLLHFALDHGAGNGADLPCDDRRVFGY